MNLRKEIFNLAQKRSPREIERALIILGAASSTANKLVYGTYVSEPGQKLKEQIENVLEEFKQKEG